MSDSDIAVLHAELRQVNTKLDALTEAFNRAAHGDGFHRCARHSERLKQVESGIELCHDRISRVKKWIIGGLISIASLAINYAWSLIQSSVKH